MDDIKHSLNQPKTFDPDVFFGFLRLNLKKILAQLEYTDITFRLANIIPFYLLNFSHITNQG